MVGEGTVLDPEHDPEIGETGPGVPLDDLEYLRPVGVLEQIIDGIDTLVPHLYHLEITFGGGNIKGYP